MPTMFQSEQHQQQRLGEQDKEDIPLAVQIPVALTTLAVLFFLS